MYIEYLNKEVALMRRILLLAAVAAMMAAMMAVAGVASATVHPLSNAECSEAPEGTGGFVAAELQDPPGLTPPPAGTGNSQGSPPNNPFGSTLAQPVFAVLGAQGADSPAFKQAPVPGSPDYCPANK